jgi:hypothetical protein
MMQLQKKPIKTTVRRMRLCLVIPLGGGAKAQYPVSSEAEAQALYEEFVLLNAHFGSLLQESGV